MSDNVNRAVILWTLERFFEEKGCQHLITKSGNQENFIQKINTNKNRIMQIPTGKWMFNPRTKELQREVRDIDIGELCVIIQKTDLNKEIDEDTKNGFISVRTVRNFLAHKGQRFGVDITEYNLRLTTLKDSLDRLKIEKALIDNIVNKDVTEDEVDGLKSFQIKSRAQLQDQLLEQLAISLADEHFEDFDLSPILGQLQQKKVLTRNEVSLIKSHTMSTDQNVKFNQLMRSKSLEDLLAFIEVVRPGSRGFASTFDPYVETPVI